MFPVYSKNIALRLPQLSQVRTVVITRNKKDNRLLQLRERAKKNRKYALQKPKLQAAKPKESAASLWLRKDKERQLQKENSELGQNIKQLREFTLQLKLKSVTESEEKKRKELVKELSVLDDPEKLLSEDIDVLMDNLTENPIEKQFEFPKLKQIGSADTSLLFEYAENEALLQLPPSLIDKIGDSIKYIRKKETQNWELMIRDMYNKNGMIEMNEREVAKLIMNIPKKEKDKTISFINEMMFEAGIEKDQLIYNLFLTAYASDSKYEILCESLFEEMKMKGLKPDLYTFSSLIKSHGVSDNVIKINKTLELMRNEYNLEPNKQIYTSVLQTCVRLKDHKQANEVFDMMKFVSTSTQPDSKAYESIILSNIEDDNIERSLDLYDEMMSQTRSLKPTANTLLMLARGCTSRKELFMRAWGFIFEYHDLKYPPNAKMLETMMHLAAKDGDASFARALFNTLMESRINDDDFNPGSTAISLLMLSYANFHIDHKPISMLNERVRTLKARTIDLTTFNFLPPKSPPFLPIEEIISDKSILAESNAIWAYNVLNFHDFINHKAVGSYLYAACSKGDSISEFIRRFETATFLDKTGIPDEETGKIEIIEQEQQDDDVFPDPLEQALKTIKSEPPAVQLSFASNFKIARTNEFYNIAIVAAKHFKDLEFATRIWTERGKFRKSDDFKKMSSIVRYKKDFEFAQHMLSFFTDMKLLEDLTMIVLSSQNQFNWEWHHIKPTYKLAEISGNEDVKSFLSAAVNNTNYKLRPQYTYLHPKGN